MKDKLTQMPTISEIRAAVVPLAGKYGLDRVFLFGSYARGDATSHSDIDFRINRGALRGIQIGGLYEDLQEILERPIDLLTTEQLSNDFLDGIKEEEILIYAQ